MKFRIWLESLSVWFGDSKVVDAQGNPLVVYTGTSKDKDFNIFRPGKAGLIWFTSDPASASEYAMNNDSMRIQRAVGSWELERKNTHSRVYPVYLRIENPYVDENSPIHPDFKQQSQYILSKMRGHDGYIDRKNGIYVVTNPLQVKSATGNRGDFDPKNPNIKEATFTSTTLK